MSLDSPHKKIEFRKIRTVFETINVAAEFIHQNFFSLLKSIVYIAFSFILFAFLSNTLFAFLTLGIEVGNWGDLANISSMSGLIILIFFIFLVVGFLMFINVIFQYMILYQQKERFYSISVNEVSQRVFRDLWMFVSTSFGLIALFILLLIPMVLVMIIPFIGIFAIYAFLLYLGMISPMIFMMRAVERNGFFNAISRSRKLLEGQFWPTLGLFFLTNMIATCLSFVPSMLVIGLTGGLATFGLHYFSFLIIVLQVLLVIVYLLTNAFFFLVIGFRYYALVELKEGVGTIEKIKFIGSQNQEL